MKAHPLQSPRGRKPGTGWKPTEEELTKLRKACEFVRLRPTFRLFVRFTGGPGAVGTLAITLNKSGRYRPVLLRSFKRAVGNNCIEVFAPAGTLPLKAPIRCAAARDGECIHLLCPQILAGEPAKTGRHCPIDNRNEDD